MKTTLDLPDDLVRAVRAQERGTTKIRKRVKLPLIDCAHPAPPGEEMTPERVAEVLLEEEAGAFRDALR